MVSSIRFCTNAIKIGLSAFLLLLATGTVSADAATKLQSNRSQPNDVGYQASLTGNDGQPVPNGSYTMIFKLIPDSAGTEILWTETRSLNTSDGLFSVYLGEVTPLTDSILEIATYLQITVDGEVLNPPTRLASSPSSYFAGTARSLRGDVITETGSLYLPGDNPLEVPKAVELSKNGSCGRLGIWGTGGTTKPSAEIVIDNGSGILNLYPGSEWIGGPDTALSMSVDSAGGRFGIWGNSGTHIPLLQMAGTASGGQLGIWGTNGTSFPRLNLYGDMNGGVLVLRSTGDAVSIFLDGAVSGDASVRLPESAINADEITNEPGLARDRTTSCIDIDSTSMYDLAEVTITIPADGYIILTGTGQVEFGGTTSLNRIDVQIDQTSEGGSINGYFTRIGLANYGGTSYGSFSFSTNRTYFKNAGTHTFYLEARRLSLSGNASSCWPVLTAVYIPTSYGSVSTIASDNGGGTAVDDGMTAIQNLAGSYVRTKDLRELEIRAKDARAQALQAELELANARSGLSNR